MVAVKSRHLDCTHANTTVERDRCRREQGKYSASQLKRIESYRLDQEVRAEQEPVGKAPRNILDYVTREFQAGAEGKRSQLPSTYDVAMACIPGAEDVKTSCRLARRYLRILESSGKIICVRDEKEARDAWVISYESTFWALPDSGRQIPVAVTVSGLTRPLAPWQLECLRDIDAAEAATCVWQPA